MTIIKAISLDATFKDYAKDDLVLGSLKNNSEIRRVLT
jgi:hypothetical protein